MTSSITRRTAITGAALASTALVLAACASRDQSTTSSTSGAVTLTIMTNAIAGGKNAAEADWIADWVIPEFTAAQKEAGRSVQVVFEAQGVDDEDYKTKAALDFRSGKGADVVGLDGIWIGEFAQAGYIRPLEEIAGDTVTSWDGWEQIPEAVQQAASFEGRRYGVPQGADGRVIYYNRNIFERAGLPTDWQPASWDDILETARTLKQRVDDVVPLQLNAGTAMGEATTMQGFLPMLVGTGQAIWDDGMWAGDTPGMRQVLDLYKTIYVDEGLGDPILQQEASGRDASFQEFAEGRIAILLEGDYFWRSVINPDEAVGTAPMADRDTLVGYAKIPAVAPGGGINGQDFVSMSGGTARVLNPNSANPQLAWELLAFMNSLEAFRARAEGTLSISPRDDVNEQLLASDPMLSFVSEEVLPITSYRPGLAEYPEVSVLLQQATLDVVTGTSVDEAMGSYVTALEGVVGADAISGD